jgi:orotate phosphoribosyltransferase
MDRQERGQNADDPRSAAAQTEAEFGIPVLAVAGLKDLLKQNLPEVEAFRDALLSYRAQYGTQA